MTFAPDPLHMVYDALLGITIVMVALLWAMPESAREQARRGCLALAACQRAAASRGRF